MINSQFPVLALAVLFVIGLMNCSVKESNSSINSIIIGEQEWSASNLDIITFQNGDTIPHAINNQQWEIAGREGKPAWCYYENDPENGIKFGKLYNWYAITDPRGFAPQGWHLPSHEEWKQLVDFLGGPEVAGIKMKSTKGWDEDGNGTNDSGFAGLPGGHRNGNGDFYNVGMTGSWWSITESDTNRFMIVHPSLLSYGDMVYTLVHEKDRGFSVRIIRD